MSNYVVDESDLMLQCMALQIRKGITHKILYNSLPFIATLPDYDYANNPMNPGVELDLNVASDTAGYWFIISPVDKLMAVIDDSRYIESFELAAVVRFSSAGKHTIRFFTSDNSPITIGDSSRSIMNISGTSQKAGTDAALIGARIFGNVILGGQYVFFNSTRLKYITIYNSFANTLSNYSGMFQNTALTHVAMRNFIGDYGTGLTPYVAALLPSNNGIGALEKAVCMRDVESSFIITGAKSTFLSLSSSISDSTFSVTAFGEASEVYLQYNQSVGGSILLFSSDNITPIDLYIDSTQLVLPNADSSDYTGVTLHVPIHLIHSYCSNSEWARCTGITASSFVAMGV